MVSEAGLSPEYDESTNLPAYYYSKLLLLLISSSSSHLIFFSCFIINKDTINVPYSFSLIETVEVDLLEAVPLSHSSCFDIDEWRASSDFDLPFCRFLELPTGLHR